MENALWGIVAAGIIVNAYRSEPRPTGNSDFRSRLGKNLLSAIVVFLAVFFLGSFIGDLDLLAPPLIALYLLDASSLTAPYVAALFVSLLDLLSRVFVGFYYVLNRQSKSQD